MLIFFPRLQQFIFWPSAAQHTQLKELRVEMQGGEGTRSTASLWPSQGLGQSFETRYLRGMFAGP